MKIKQVDHVTIVVKDIEKTKKFYGELLGFRFLEAVKLGDHICHYFEIPGGQKLELTEYLYYTEDASFQPNNKGIFRHLAFEVDDVKTLEMKLEEAGYKFHYPVGHTRELGVNNGLVHDPNGVELEFLEYV